MILLCRNSIEYRMDLWICDSWWGYPISVYCCQLFWAVKFRKCCERKWYWFSFIFWTRLWRYAIVSDSFSASGWTKTSNIYLLSSGFYSNFNSDRSKCDKLSKNLFNNFRKVRIAYGNLSCSYPSNQHKAHRWWAHSKGHQKTF